MTFPVEILKLAELEISEAFIFYEEEAENLGDKFLKSLERSIEIIGSNPKLYPKRRKPYRACPMKDFPFLIFYSIEKEKILIHSIFNTSRDPKNWIES